jgi:hypothetical protein
MNQFLLFLSYYPLNVPVDKIIRNGWLKLIVLIIDVLRRDDSIAPPDLVSFFARPSVSMALG